MDLHKIQIPSQQAHLSRPPQTLRRFVSGGKRQQHAQIALRPLQRYF